MYRLEVQSPLFGDLSPKGKDGGCVGPQELPKEKRNKGGTLTHQEAIIFHFKGVRKFHPRLDNF